MRSRINIFLFLLIILSCKPKVEEATSAPSQDDSTQPKATVTAKYELQADSIFTNFKERRFETIVAHFDDALKIHLDEPRLASTWDNLLAQTGELLDKGNITQRSGPQFQEVFVECIFKGGTLYMKLVYNKENRIAGLFFQPTMI